MQNLWDNAKSISVQTGEIIVGGFIVGFDVAIDEKTQEALM